MNENQLLFSSHFHLLNSALDLVYLCYYLKITMICTQQKNSRVHYILYFGNLQPTFCVSVHMYICTDALVNQFFT